MEITESEINILKLHRDNMKSLSNNTRNAEVRFRIDEEVYRVRDFLNDCYKKSIRTVGVKKAAKLCLKCEVKTVNLQ